MAWIAVDKNFGLLFEGQAGYGNAVIPTPRTAPVAIISEAEFPPELPPWHGLENATLLSREDSFEAVTRVRRGRVYFASEVRPADWDVHEPRGRGKRSV